MKDDGGKAGERLSTKVESRYKKGLNTHLVPIFVKIIQSGPYFGCLFNLVLVLVKSHSIESFWQTKLKF